MALWGISTTTEIASNYFNLPKYVHNVARANSRHDVFADPRGWVQRHYKTQERSGLSTHYYDEVLVPIIGLNTTGIGASSKGLGSPTPVAVFFEDPNRNSIISVGSGGTSGISTGTTGYVHLCFNEIVYVSAGATIGIQAFTAAGVSTGSGIVATASSINPNVTVANWTWTPFTSGNPGAVLTKGFNGQITNRIAFAFTAPSSGIGTVLRINIGAGVVGVITDVANNSATVTTISGSIVRNTGGAGSYNQLQNDGSTPIGIGTTTLTVKA